MRARPVFSRLATSTMALALVACAPQKSLTAELAPHSVRALNLEETISQRDELMLLYSLTSYDAKNQPAGVVNGAWGVVPIKKDQQIELTSQAKPIQLALPKNGRVVAALVLIEVDDYTRAQETLTRVQKIHNMISVPAGLLLTATEVLTPLKYVTAGLLAAGVGLRVVDQFDTDDLLGQSSTVLKEADVRKANRQSWQVPATFTGQHLRDSFAYELVYDVLLKTVKLKPGGQ